jgi:hypothetical protein
MTEQHEVDNPEIKAYKNTETNSLWKTAVPITSYHHITRDIFTVDHFTESILSTYHKNVTRHTKREK